MTEMRELEADGWERHERSKSAAAPLTGEEEALKILKEAEAEARGGGGMVGRRLEVGSRSKMGMMGDVRDALERLKEGRKGDNLVQLVCFYR